MVSYKYYKSNKLLGEIKNRLVIRKIIYDRYRIIIKNYVNYIFLLEIIFFIIYMENIQLLFFVFIISFLARIILSLFETSKIKDINNINIGIMKHVILSNTVKIILYKDIYEIYSHGSNVFSVTKNDIQIALIKSSGKIIANEFCFEVDCLGNYYNLLPLFVICIDSKFYSYRLGIRNSLIYFPVNTYNFNDKHRERTIWRSS